jgi:predicted PurR-regulated permease PerM
MAANPKDGIMEIQVSSWTIMKVICIIAAAWVLYALRDIIGLVLVALLFAAVITPATNWFERKKIPRTIGALIIYISIFSLVGVLLTFLIPPLISEVSSLAGNFGSLWGRVMSSFSLIKDQPYYTDDVAAGVTHALSNIESALSRFVQGAFFAVAGAFGGLLSVIVTLVLAFYIVIQGSNLQRIFGTIMPTNYALYITSLANKIQEKILLWARGQLILSASIAVLSYISLLIIGVDYALVIALFAGVTEMIPYAGPLIGGAVAVLFALAQSPFQAFLVAITFIIIQQAENHILVPKVMQHSVGINPIFSIIAILIGARFGGIPGVIFAIPAVTAVEIVIRELFMTPRQSEKHAV